MGIIGVSGKINSGKDLIGKIINFLATGGEETYVSDENQSAIQGFLEFYEDARNEDGTYMYPWAIKKFADKLKDIICLLIGCTREQLEDREFKETPLGAEWSRVLFRDMSDPVGIIAETTPRWLLQRIGTEAMRERVHNEIWVNALFADYKGELKEVAGSGMFSRAGMFTEYPNWIITDTRFENEAKAIKDRGGIIIRVNRPIAGVLSNHPSEIGLDDYLDFDHVIVNGGTIEELVEKIRTILIMEKIIS